MLYLCMKITEALQKIINTEVDEASILYNYYLGELSNVLEAKKSLEKMERDIREKISKYDKKHTSVYDRSSDYPLKGTWTERIDFIIGDESLSAKEVALRMAPYHPELEGKLSNSVYPTLSDNSKGENSRYIKVYDESLKANRFKLRKK